MYNTPPFVSEFFVDIDQRKLNIEEFSRNPTNRHEILQALKQVGLKPISLDDLQKHVEQIRSDAGKRTHAKHVENVLKDWNKTCNTLRFGIKHDEFDNSKCEIRDRFHRVCAYTQYPHVILYVDRSIRTCKPTKMLRKRVPTSYEESSEDSDAYAPQTIKRKRVRRLKKRSTVISSSDSENDEGNNSATSTVSMESYRCKEISETMATLSGTTSPSRSPSVETISTYSSSACSSFIGTTTTSASARSSVEPVMDEPINNTSNNMTNINTSQQETEEKTLLKEIIARMQKQADIQDARYHNIREEVNFIKMQMQAQSFNSASFSPGHKTYQPRSNFHNGYYQRKNVYERTIPTQP